MKVSITCPECDGKGWEVVYGWHGLPEQEKCICCNGDKKVLVSAEYAQAVKDLNHP